MDRVHALSVVGRLRRDLAQLYGSRLRGVYLYGSCARDEAEAGSDVDVLIVLDGLESYWREIERTSESVAGYSLEVGTTVSVVFVTEAAWIDIESAFLENVRQEAIAA